MVNQLTKPPKISVGEVLVKSCVAFPSLFYYCPIDKCVQAFDTKEIEELDNAERIMWGIQEEGFISKDDIYIAYPMCSTHGVFLDATEKQDTEISGDVEDAMFGFGFG